MVQGGYEMHLQAFFGRHHALSSKLIARFAMLLSTATALFLPLSASAFFDWGEPAPAPDELGPYGEEASHG